MKTSDEDDRDEVWDARADALSHVLGAGHDNVFHARHPFAFGGQADVMVYYHHLDGVVYVTAELTGKPEACYADYELMICHRAPSDWGPNVISRLAPYTQEAYIGSGESMDIDDATPAESQIKAFIFDTYATFTLYGRQNDLRLCVGITKAELQFKLEHGPEKLLERLKLHTGSTRSRTSDARACRLTARLHRIGAAATVAAGPSPRIAGHVGFVSGRDAWELRFVLFVGQPIDS